MDRWLTRRALLAVGLIGAAASVSPAVAQETGAARTVDPAALRFRRIVVDASPVARLGSATTASLLEQYVSREARAIFADRMAPSDARAPQLLIRIDSFQFASYVGNNSRVRRGSADTDYLEGAGLVVADGRVLSTTPVLSALDAGYSGAWYLPDVDDRRIASISHHFASWLRQQMGL